MPHILKKWLASWARKALEFSLSDGWAVEKFNRIGGTINNSPIDYGALVGGIWRNSAVRACMQAWESAFTQSGIEVITGTKAKFVVVENSALSSLIDNPNPYYDGSVLMCGTLASLADDGNAYWFPKKNPLTREVEELYYIPHCFVEPENEDDRSRLITRYRYTVNGKVEYRKPEDVIHLRVGIDPQNQRRGYGWLKSVKDEIFTDNESTLYTASVLSNAGVVGWVASYDGEKVAYTPSDIKALIEQNTQGHNRGRTAVFDFPVSLESSAFSPEQLMLDKIRQVPEARIAAVMKVPAMVAGLSIGENQRTYANYGEAREAFLEDSVLPLMQVIARQLTRQLLPWVSINSANERVRFDTSMFRALQADTDKRNQRVREDYKAGIIDLYTALSETEREATDADRGVRYSQSSPSEAALQQETIDEARKSFQARLAARRNGHKELTA